MEGMKGIRAILHRRSMGLRMVRDRSTMMSMLMCWLNGCRNGWLRDLEVRYSLPPPGALPGVCVLRWRSCRYRYWCRLLLYCWQVYEDSVGRLALVPSVLPFSSF